MNDTYTTQLSPWEEYADEHILLLRKFSGEESIPVEFVHVIKDADDQSGVLFSHGVMFVGTIDREDEKTAEWLNELAQAYGYRDFDAKVKEYPAGDDTAKVLPVGKAAADMDPMALASMIAESSSGDALIPMTEENALQLVKTITGKDYAAV